MGGGDPYNYAEGAAGKDGIVFDGCSTYSLKECTVSGHGGHGIFLTNGTWVGSFDNNIIYGNKKDGINSKSVSGENIGQNGNNLIIDKNIIHSNGGSGLNWRAAQCSVTNNDIEANKGPGILLDMTDALVPAFAMTIEHNYIEQNYGGQVKVISGNSGVRNLIIEKNFINASYTDVGSPTSLIVFEGQKTNQFVEIGNNSYSIFNTHIKYYVDGGNTLTDTCKTILSGTSSQFTNLGDTHIETSRVKTKLLSGLTGQKGVEWSFVGKSENAIGANTSAFFHIPLDEDSFIQTIRIFVETDSSSYAAVVHLYEGNPKTSIPVSSVLSETKNYPSGGDSLIGLSVNRRIKKDHVYYFRITIEKPLTGTELYLNDVVLTYV